MGCCWLLGAGPGPFCVEFACSPCVHKGFLPLRTQTEKHAKEQNTCRASPDQDALFNWSPGAEKLPTDPGGGTIRDGLKAEVEFTATSSLRVPASCVASIYNTCVLQ